MSEKSFELIQFIYQKNDQFKNILYTRSSIVIGIYVFIIPGLINLIDKYPKLIKPLNSIDYFFIIVIVFTLFSSSLSLYYAVKSIQPFNWINRLKNLLINKNKRRKGKQDQSLRPLTAFPYIVPLKYKDFENRILSLDDDGILREMLKGLYNLSHINNDRYANLKKAYNFLFTTMIFFIIVVFIWFIKKHS